MKRFALAAMTAALMSSGAYAADVFGGGSTKDAPVGGEVRSVNWTGFYIGGNLGYGNANHNLTLEQYHGAYCWDRDGTQTAVQPEDSYDPWDGAFDGHVDQLNSDGTCGGPAVLGTETGPYANGGTKPHGNGATAQTNAWDENDHAKVDGRSRDIANLDGLNSRGLVGDGRIGFDVRRGRFVLGLFGAYGFSDMETTGNLGNLASLRIEKGDEWSIGGRAGLLVNERTLAYILAAYTETDYDFTVAGFGSTASRNVTFSGVTVGGGVEFALTNNVFLGLEGTHTFYGEETIWDSGVAADEVSGLKLKDELGETKVMGTLKIKLNSDIGRGFID